MGDQVHWCLLMEKVQHKLSIPDELAGKRLDQALAELLPDYSRSKIKEWILAGQVSLDGETPVPRTRIAAGQQVVLDAVQEEQVTTGPEAMDLSVIYEDESILVIDKPAGLVVHPGAGNAAGTLVNGLLHYDPELAHLPRGGLLHRLDKDTAGLLLVARDLPAHTRLVRDLQDRKITREYRAVCGGRLTAGGQVDAPVGRHPTHRTRMAVTDRGKPAVTHFRVLRRFAAHTFLALRLEAGRTHQIRVHMAHVRHPLAGDPVYGGRLKMPAGMSDAQRDALHGFHRQALHASRLMFRHPADDREMVFQSRLPDDFVTLLQVLDDSSQPAAFYNELQWPETHPASN